MTTMSKSDFTEYIRGFRFKELFNYFGWDNDNTKIPIEVDEDVFILTSVASKSGFKIFICPPGPDGEIPLQTKRIKIDSRLSPASHDHLIIYINKNNTQQLWQFIYKISGQAPKRSEVNYHINMDTEKLYERTSGLVFELDEEDKITIVDVNSRVKSNFAQNSERLTKKFYESFKKYHKDLISFISGIDTQINQEWYASLMLNRLMFCYFIQKKGFLDGDKNYLYNRLVLSQKKYGNDKFYSFYKNFLLILFHEGLGNNNHTRALHNEIGNVPYLNGGLFDIHEIEENNPSIEIPDEAFERLFLFFDQWDWHLDTYSPNASGNEINPDVLGYIFEKYINDRANMGAYYTQEDITEYISRNSIIPYLLEKTKSKDEMPFSEGGLIWKYLRDNGDRYIFDEIKKGIEYPLPKEIEVGTNNNNPNLINERKSWNKIADNKYSLINETWRDVIERRDRYVRILNKINSDEIISISDFTTYNLDIRSFIYDFIVNTDDYDFVIHFFDVLRECTILDPTCGSGAFLFAALNVLEPLYDACITRFNEILQKENKNNKHYKYAYLVISEINDGNHPNRDYYIYKSIILNNLYGVDIMKEATETAKLRLFLKLMSCVEPRINEPNMGIEPLPDIDFNIKSGNSLVGFADKDEINNALVQTISGLQMASQINEKCEQLSIAYNRYKKLQLSWNNDLEKLKNTKKEAVEKQNTLNYDLNIMLSSSPNIHSSKNINKWVRTYQPFHWYAEFYEIIALNEGFDIIIGNPPYVDTKKIDYISLLNQYSCTSCKDLFALTIERAYKLLKQKGKMGVIVPLSATSTDTMKDLTTYIFNSASLIHTSYFSASAQPSTLFNGVRHRLLILLTDKNGEALSKKIYSTNFLKWFASEREFLFNTKVRYCETLPEYPFIKIGNYIEKVIFEKLIKFKPLSFYMTNSNSYNIYYHNAPVHWGKVFDFIPYYRVGKDKPSCSSHIKSFGVSSQAYKNCVICALNSSLFYWYNWLQTNCRDLSKTNISNFPIGLDTMSEETLNRIGFIHHELMKSLKENSTIYKRISKNVPTEFDSFYPMYSKGIIDEVDTLLARHFGLTEEELDYILNYDIKYRMGSNEDEE